MKKEKELEKETKKMQRQLPRMLKVVKALLLQKVESLHHQKKLQLKVDLQLMKKSNPQRKLFIQRQKNILT
jgi:hypothetical protein